jgi:hypothetical protein
MDFALRVLVRRCSDQAAAVRAALDVRLGGEVPSGRAGLGCCDVDCERLGRFIIVEDRPRAFRRAVDRIQLRMNVLDEGGRSKDVSARSDDPSV